MTTPLDHLSEADLRKRMARLTRLMDTGMATAAHAIEAIQIAERLDLIKRAKQGAR